MTTIYKCLDCEGVFDEPIVATEYYECWGRPVYEEKECCPYCYGWAFEEYDPYEDDYDEE